MKENVFPDVRMTSYEDTGFYDFDFVGGLTKRELFAAFAMNAHIFHNFNIGSEITAQDLAKGAFAVADGMIEFLKQEGKHE